MTVNEVLEAIEEHGLLHTRCDVCGHNWKSRAEDDLKCNFCHNAPQRLTLSGTLLTLRDDGSPIFD